MNKDNILNTYNNLKSDDSEFANKFPSVDEFSTWIKQDGKLEQTYKNISEYDSEFQKRFTTSDDFKKYLGLNIVEQSAVNKVGISGRYNWDGTINKEEKPAIVSKEKSEIIFNPQEVNGQQYAENLVSNAQADADWKKRQEENGYLRNALQHIFTTPDTQGLPEDEIEQRKNIALEEEKKNQLLTNKYNFEKESESLSLQPNTISNINENAFEVAMKHHPEETKALESDFNNYIGSVKNEYYEQFKNTDEYKQLTKPYYDRIHAEEDAYKKACNILISECDKKINHGATNAKELEAELNKNLQKLKATANANISAIEDDFYNDKNITDAFYNKYGNEIESKTEERRTQYYEQLNQLSGGYRSYALNELGKDDTENSWRDTRKKIEERFNSVDLSERQKQINMMAMNSAEGAALNLTTPYVNEAVDAALQYSHKSENIIKAVKGNEGFWKGIGRTATDIDTWDSGITALKNSAELKRVVKKYEDNGEDESKLTEDERLLMQAATDYAATLAYYSPELRRTYKMGTTFTQSIPYMLEFAISPISSIEGAVGKGLTRFAVKRLSKLTGKGFGRTVRKSITKGIGNLASAEFMTLTWGMPKMIAGFNERTTGEIKPEFTEDGKIVYGGIVEGSRQSNLEAGYNAHTDQFVENYSEIALDALKPFAQYGKNILKSAEWFKNLQGKELIQTLAGIHNQPWLKTIRDNVQFHGYIGENVEELLGGLLRKTFSTDVNTWEEAGLDKDGMIDTFLGLAPTSILFAGLGFGGAAINGAKTMWNAKKIKETMTDDVEKHLFNQMMKESRSGEFGIKAHDYIRAVINDPKLSEEEKKNILRFTISKYSDVISSELKNGVEDLNLNDWLDKTVPVISNTNGDIVQTKDASNRTVYIVDGNVEYKDVPFDNGVVRIIDTDKSDKQLTVVYEKEDGGYTEPKQIDSNSFTNPVFEIEAKDYIGMHKAANTARHLQEDSFEYDGLVYDVESGRLIGTKEEVEEQRKQEAQKAQDDVQANKPVQETESVAVQNNEPTRIALDEKQIEVSIGDKNSVVTVSGDAVVNADGTIDFEQSNLQVRDENDTPIRGRKLKAAKQAINESLLSNPIQQKQEQVEVDETPMSDLDLFINEQLSTVKPTATISDMTPQQRFAYGVKKYGLETALQASKDNVKRLQTKIEKAQQEYDANVQKEIDKLQNKDMDAFERLEKIDAIKQKQNQQIAQLQQELAIHQALIDEFGGQQEVAPEPAPVQEPTPAKPTKKEKTAEELAADKAEKERKAAERKAAKEEAKRKASAEAEAKRVSAIDGIVKSASDEMTKLGISSEEAANYIREFLNGDTTKSLMQFADEFLHGKLSVADAMKVLNKIDAKLKESFLRKNSKYKDTTPEAFNALQDNDILIGYKRTTSGFKWFACRKVGENEIEWLSGQPINSKTKKGSRYTIGEGIGTFNNKQKAKAFELVYDEKGKLKETREVLVLNYGYLKGDIKAKEDIRQQNHMVMLADGTVVNAKTSNLRQEAREDAKGYIPTSEEKDAAKAEKANKKFAELIDKIKSAMDMFEQQPLVGIRLFDVLQHNNKRNRADIFSLEDADIKDDERLDGMTIAELQKQLSDFIDKWNAVMDKYNYDQFLSGKGATTLKVDKAKLKTKSGKKAMTKMDILKSDAMADLLNAVKTINNLHQIDNPKMKDVVKQENAANKQQKEKNAQKISESEKKEVSLQSQISEEDRKKRIENRKKLNKRISKNDMLINLPKDLNERVAFVNRLITNEDYNGKLVIVKSVKDFLDILKARRKDLWETCHTKYETLPEGKVGGFVFGDLFVLPVNSLNTLDDVFRVHIHEPQHLLFNGRDGYKGGKVNLSESEQRNIIASIAGSNFYDKPITENDFTEDQLAIRKQKYGDFYYSGFLLKNEFLSHTVEICALADYMNIDKTELLREIGVTDQETINTILDVYENEKQNFPRLAESADISDNRHELSFRGAAQELRRIYEANGRGKQEEERYLDIIQDVLGSIGTSQLGNPNFVQSLNNTQKKRANSTGPLTPRIFSSPEQISRAYELDKRLGSVACMETDVHEMAAFAMPDTRVSDWQGMPKEVYHATDDEFRAFDLSKRTANHGRVLGDRFYFALDKYSFADYGKNNLPFYVNITNPYYASKPLPLDVIESHAEQFTEWFGDKWRDNSYVQEKLRIPRGLIDLESAYNINNLVEQLGYDGIIYDGYAFEPAQIAISDPSQVKSAQAITYDEQGNAIPLMQRFNFDEADFNLKVITKQTRNQVAAWMAKRRPELNADQRATVIDWLEQSFDDTNTQLAAGWWFVNGNVKIGEDDEKIKQAVRIASNHNVQASRFSTPAEIMEAYVKPNDGVEPINPNTVPTLHKVNWDWLPKGLEIFDVDDSYESQENMRKIIDTHFGNEANPWCLLQQEDGRLTYNATSYWKDYGGGYRAAFQNGKLVAFMSNKGEELWWDRRDKRHKGIPYQEKIDSKKKQIHYVNVNEYGSMDVIELSPIFSGDPHHGHYVEYAEDGKTIVMEQDLNKGLLDGTLVVNNQGGKEIYRVKSHIEIESVDIKDDMGNPTGEQKDVPREVIDEISIPLLKEQFPNNNFKNDITNAGQYIAIHRSEWGMGNYITIQRTDRASFQLDCDDIFHIKNLTYSNNDNTDVIECFFDNEGSYDIEERLRDNRISRKIYHDFFDKEGFKYHSYVNDVQNKCETEIYYHENGNIESTRDEFKNGEHRIVKREYYKDGTPASVSIQDLIHGTEKRTEYDEYGDIFLESRTTPYKNLEWFDMSDPTSEDKVEVFNARDLVNNVEFNEERINGKTDSFVYFNEVGERIEITPEHARAMSEILAEHITDDGIQLSVRSSRDILDFGLYDKVSERTSDILVAEAMERSGEDAGTIQTATGLVRGADNVWYDSAVDEEQAEKIAEKYAENLHMSEKNSNFANNIEYEREQDEVSKWLSRNANGAVQARSLQSADGELLMEQSRSDRGSIEGDRTGREDGNSRELGIPDELRRGLVNPLTAVNDAIEKRLSDFGIKHTSKRAVQVDAKTFHDAISEYKRQDKPMKWCVDVHDVNGDTENHPYVDCICLLLEDGKAGIAVTSEGDIISVFSNSPERNVLDKLLPMALAVGGKKADFYTTRTQFGLQNMYARYGLIVTGQTPFNTEYAPEDWDGDTNHTVGAGVFTLPVEKAIQFKAEHPDLIVDLDNVPMFDDLENGYGQMMDDRDNQLEDLIESEEAQLSVVNPRVITSPAQVSEETVKRMSQHAAEKMAVVDDPVAPLWSKAAASYKKVVQDTMDNTEAQRGVENWLNEMRRLHGTTPAERKPISAKQSVRNALGALESAVAGQIDVFEKTELKALMQYINKLVPIIEKSKVYKKYKKDAIQAGEKNANELSVLDFIERYLIARSNVEQFEIDYPEALNPKTGKIDESKMRTRGEGAFAKRMSRDNGEITDMATFSNEFLNEIGTKNVEGLWEKIRACTDYSLEMLHDSKVLSDELYNEYLEREYYIPQKGFEEKEINPDNYIQVKGGRFSIKHPTAISNKREGGESLAGSVLSYMIYDIHNSIRTAKTNEVRLKMYNLLIQNEQYFTPYGINRPNKIYTVKQRDENGNFIKDKDGNYLLEEVPVLSQEDEDNYNIAMAAIRELRRRKEKAKTKEEKQQIQSDINRFKEDMYVYSTRNRRGDLRTQAELNQTKVDVWVDGELYQMDLRGMEDVANALNGVRNNEWALDHIKTVTNSIAALCTTYNPAFFAVNIVRDVPFIAIKGAIEYGAMFDLYFTREMLNLTGTTHVINKWIWTGTFDENDENGRMLHDFITNGGATGFNHAEDIEKIKKKWENAMKTNYATQYTIGALGTLAKNVNEYSELLTRFSAYKAVLQLGYSKEEAIRAAKNLSVNFNRKGQGNKLINAFSNLSMFTNAAIQGASGLWRTFDAKNGESQAWRITKATTMFALVPMVSGFFMTLFTMDNDDDEKKIDKFYRDNFICFGNWRIPLNEQIKPFWVIGVNLALGMHNRRSPGDITDSVISTLLTNLVPLPPAMTKAGTMVSNKVFGGEDISAADIVQRTITPQALATINYLAENKDFMGNSLSKEDNIDMPQYLMAEHESKFYRDIAKAFYWAGGGDLNNPSTYRKGDKTKKILFDVNPRQVKAYLSVLPNGYLDILKSMVGIGEMIDDGKVRWKDIPIANKFYRPVENQETFYRYNIYKEARKLEKQYDEMVKNLNTQYKNGNDDAARVFLEANKDYLEEGYNIEYLKGYIDMYKKTNLYNIAKSHGMTEKEFKKKYDITDTQPLDELQKIAAKGMRECLYQGLGTEKAVDWEENFWRTKLKK